MCSAQMRWSLNNLSKWYVGLPVIYAIKLVIFYELFPLTTYSSVHIVSCRPLWREKCGD